MDKYSEKLLELKLEETDFNKINYVEKLISRILIEDNFNKLNYLQKTIKDPLDKEFKFLENNEGFEFISINKSPKGPYSKILSEEDFYRIIQKTKNGIAKRSGKYQQSLYSHYLKALEENDEGYISDVLTKAVVFENNLNYVKTLENNKDFIKAWRKNYGKESPVTIFKNEGNLKKINLICSLINK